MFQRPFKLFLKKQVSLIYKSDFYFFESLKNAAFKAVKNQNKDQQQMYQDKKDKSKTHVQDEYSKEHDRLKRENPDFMSKDDYIKALRKERYAYEKEREQSKQEWADLDQRMMREQQVKFEAVDFNKLMMANINIIPVETFNHPEQLFYFITNLNVQISEENIIKCIDGFLSLSDQIEPELLESQTYAHFVGLVEDNLNIIAEEKNLVKIAQFADLFCISEIKFWEILERKIVSKINKMEAHNIISLLGSFSNQKEGSEYFYNNIQKIVGEHVENGKVQFSELVQIAQSFYRIKAGTMEFFNQISVVIRDNIQQASFEEIIKLSQIFKNIKEYKHEMFEKLETRVMEFLNDENFSVNIDFVCHMADGFGFEMGSNEMFDKLIDLAMPKADLIQNKNDLQIFLKGFVYSYRGNEKIMSLLADKIIYILQEQESYMVNNKANKEEMDSLSEVFFTVTEIANISKSFYMAEHSNLKLDFMIEQLIIAQIKDVQRITIEEIQEIVKCYTITRLGSRKLYKLLEIVIGHRFEDIKKKPEVVEKLYIYYVKSGLCSPKLLSKLELLT